MIPVPLIPTTNDNGRQTPPFPMLMSHQRVLTESLSPLQLPPRELLQHPGASVVLSATPTGATPSILLPEEPLTRRVLVSEPSEDDMSDNKNTPSGNGPADPLLIQNPGQDAGKKRKYLQLSLGNPREEEEHRRKRGRERADQEDVDYPSASTSESVPYPTVPGTIVQYMTVAPTVPSANHEHHANITGLSRTGSPVGQSPTVVATAQIPTTIGFTHTDIPSLSTVYPLPYEPPSFPLPEIPSATSPIAISHSEADSEPGSWNPISPHLLRRSSSTKIATPHGRRMRPSYSPPARNVHSPVPLPALPFSFVTPTPYPQPSQPEHCSMSLSPVVAVSDDQTDSAHSPILPVVEGIIEFLPGILKEKEKTKAMRNLRGSDAQSVIDFLYLVLSRSQITESWVEKHTWILLYKLSMASELYPRCYALKGITPGDVANGGGFCDIYKGQYGKQSLCLKVVRVYDDQSRENALKSLGKEATLWSSFNHINIAPFYGIFYLETRKSICLVSPWMDHGDLVIYLRYNANASRMNLIHDIISGLEYLHDCKQVIHGDLKGMNVLVNASRRACLTDFGLSTIRTDNTLPFTHTTSYNVSLTTRWTAPEMLEGSKRSKEGDIWAFGSVCYEILTRKVPYYECLNDSAVIRCITKEQLPTRPEANPNSNIDQVSDRMWALMERCWSTEPGNRPRCSDIKQELESGGTVEPRDTDAHIKRATLQRRQFQNEMVERKDVPIDLAKVERIFRVTAGCI